MNVFSANCCRRFRSAAARCSARATGAARRSARSESLVELCEDLLSGRGEASGVALAREILGRYGELTTGPRIAFFEALAERFGPDPARMERRSPPGARSRPTRPPPKCTPPPSRAGRSCSAGSISRPAAPPRWCACASNLIDVLAHRDDSRAGRRRFRASVLVLVQSRLPGAAPHRLVDAGDHSGKDHPLRGGARDPRLGRPAPPHRSARPALLRVLPSGAGRRAADLRRGRAHARNPGAIAPILGHEREHRRAGQGAHRGVLFDLQLPARPRRRLVRQLPDQAGGRGDLPRNAEARDFRHAVAGAGLRRAGSTRERGDENSRRSTPSDKRGARSCSTSRTGGSDAGDARAAAGAADARGGLVFPARAQTRAACRSTRWRVSTSAMARGSSASTGSATSRSRAMRAGARSDGELPLRSRRHREEPRGLCGEPHRGRLRAPCSVCCARRSNWCRWRGRIRRFLPRADAGRECRVRLPIHRHDGAAGDACCRAKPETGWSPRPPRPSARRQNRPSAWPCGWPACP